MSKPPISDERFRELLGTYRAGLEAPGADVRRAVEATLRDRERHSHARDPLRWFLRPRVIHLRPVLAAAALILVVALTAAVTLLTVGDRLTRAPLADGVSAPAPSQVLVRFELRAPEATRVALSGSFNGWSDSTIPLVRRGDTGVWSVTLPLAPGQYEYLFVIDDEHWLPDPEAHAQVDDGFGNTNSMLVVGPRGVMRS